MLLLDMPQLPADPCILALLSVLLRTLELRANRNQSNGSASASKPARTTAPADNARRNAPSSDLPRTAGNSRPATAENAAIVKKYYHIIASSSLNLATEASQQNPCCSAFSPLHYHLVMSSLLHQFPLNVYHHATDPLPLHPHWFCAHQFRILETKSLYARLGVQRDCDDSTLKKAYRKMSMKVHPDKNRQYNEKFSYGAAQYCHPDMF